MSNIKTPFPSEQLLLRCVAAFSVRLEDKESSKSGAVWITQRDIRDFGYRLPSDDVSSGSGNECLIKPNQAQAVR